MPIRTANREAYSSAGFQSLPLGRQLRLQRGSDEPADSFSARCESSLESEIIDPGKKVAIKSDVYKLPIRPIGFIEHSLV
jgi:hypothetical protein